jgi:FixJ family two-component response regulator
MNVPLYPETVFLVDDDPSVLRAIGRLLRAPGCLVLDVAMPGLNGWELQEALARAGNHLPIIFLTGHCDASIRSRATQSGAVDCLGKPCPDDELLTAIKHALVRDRRLRQK